MENKESKIKGTTIFVSADIHEALVLLKLELKKDSYAEVITELIRHYRETHGWSVITLAGELKRLKTQEK